MTQVEKMKTSLSKRAWLKWLQEYTPAKFLEAFLTNVEGAEGTCTHCHQYIYVDVLIGGGVPDWSTEDGDFGCDASPDTTADCCGSHMPIKRRL